MKISIIGTGKLGSAIARRFASLTTATGDTQHTIFVWNRTNDKVHALAKSCEHRMVIAADVDEAIKYTDVVVNALVDVKAWYEWVAPGSRSFAGKTIVNLTTTSTRQARAMSKSVLRDGATGFVDMVTVSFPAEIEKGEGKFFAGTNGGAIEPNILRALEDFGHVKHTGDVGTASALEMAFFLQYATSMHAYMTGLALAERAGVPRDAFTDLMEHNSLVSSPLYPVYDIAAKLRAYSPPLMTAEHFERLLAMAFDDLEHEDMNSYVCTRMLLDLRDGVRIQANRTGVKTSAADLDWTVVYESLRV